MSAIWDLDLHHARALIGSGTIVVDLGASLGDFSLPAAAAGGTVLAVEPLPENVAALRSHGLSVLEAAAGPYDGRCSLISPDGAERPTGSHIELDPAGPVRMLSLASIIGEPPEVDVLKCDIEGGEYEAFLAAGPETLRRIRFAAIEFHTWTVGNQPRIPGVGHRPGSAMTALPGDLWRHLLPTHELELEGNFEAGGTIFATLRSEP